LARGLQGYLVKHISHSKMVQLLLDINKLSNEELPSSMYFAVLDFVCCHFKEIAQTENLNGLPNTILTALLQRLSEKYIL
jgi:hypothetical protein